MLQPAGMILEHIATRDAGAGQESQQTGKYIVVLDGHVEAAAGCEEMSAPMAFTMTAAAPNWTFLMEFIDSSFLDLKMDS